MIGSKRRWPPARGIRTKDALLDFCRALPGATEDVKWGEHLVFSVAGKMFAIFDVTDAEPIRLKVDPAVFPILTRKRGIGPAPYLARHSWIKLENTRVLPRRAIEDLLREPHELVAAKLPKRLRERLGVTIRMSPTSRKSSRSLESSTSRKSVS